MDSEFVIFDKLQEVGFSPYLGSYSHLSVLLMFRLNEAARGRWIGPKTWDRIIGNFFLKLWRGRLCTVPRRGCLG